MKKVVIISVIMLTLSGCAGMPPEMGKLAKSVLVDAVKSGVNQKVRNKVGSKTTCNYGKSKIKCKQH